MAEPVALKYRAFVSYSHADTGHGGREGRIDEDLVSRRLRSVLSLGRGAP